MSQEQLFIVIAIVVGAVIFSSVTGKSLINIIRLAAVIIFVFKIINNFDSIVLILQNNFEKLWPAITRVINKSLESLMNS